jgi:hypothetical protein
MDRPSNTWIPGFKTLKGAIKVSKLEVGLELTTYPFRKLTTITLPFQFMLKMFALVLLLSIERQKESIPWLLRW